MPPNVALVEQKQDEVEYRERAGVDDEIAQLECDVIVLKSKPFEYLQVNSNHNREDDGGKEANENESYSVRKNCDLVKEAAHLLVDLLLRELCKLLLLLLLGPQDVLDVHHEPQGGHVYEKPGKQDQGGKRYYVDYFVHLSL